MILAKCKCGRLTNKCEKLDYNSYAFDCKCGLMFVTHKVISFTDGQKIELPDLKVNDKIFCANNRSKLFLCVGIVMALDHLHAKVDFGKIKMWMHRDSLATMAEEP